MLTKLGVLKNLKIVRMEENILVFLTTQSSNSILSTILITRYFNTILKLRQFKITSNNFIKEQNKIVGSQSTGIFLFFTEENRHDLKELKRFPVHLSSDALSNRHFVSLAPVARRPIVIVHLIEDAADLAITNLARTSLTKNTIHARDVLFLFFHIFSIFFFSFFLFYHRPARRPTLAFFC